jgi:hypothetical protein
MPKPTPDIKVRLRRPPNHSEQPLRRRYGPASGGGFAVDRVMRTALPKRIRGGKMKAMQPPKDSRMANEKAAIDLQRKQPSWRATKAVNSAPTKRRLRPGSEHLVILVEAGLIALLFLTQSERFALSMTQEAQALLNQFVLDQQQCPERALGSVSRFAWRDWPAAGALSVPGISPAPSVSKRSRRSRRVR